MLRLAVLLGLSLAFAACDGTEPSAPGPSYINGVYTEAWVLETDGPGANRRTRTESVLTLRMEEANGVVTPSPASAGILDVDIRQLDTDGEVANRQFFSGNVETISGTFAPGTRAFALRIQGSRAGLEFDLTFEGTASLQDDTTPVYMQLEGRVVGDIVRVDEGSGARTVLHSYDDPVTLDRLP